MSFGTSSLSKALEALGELLEERQLSYNLVVIGGGALLLQGLLRSPTLDLDVVAQATESEYTSAEPLPPPLAQAVSEVGALFGLSESWLNAGPADLLRFGLPKGFEQRCELRRYCTLTLQLAGRLDQIAFKLYAAVDLGPKSKHFRDLQDLGALQEELLSGARWAITHDTSEPFRDQLVQALAALGVVYAEF